MIDAAIGLLEIKEISSDRADIVSNVLEKIWLSRYPRPSVIQGDLGTLAPFYFILKLK